jgi:hypothetical protein
VAARVLTWDWKEQPDLACLAAAVAEVSAGKVFLRGVETGGDEYAWVVSDYPVTDAEAEALYFS